MVIYFTATVIAAKKALERACSHCGYKQVMKPSQKRKAVACDRCGKAIMPKA